MGFTQNYAQKIGAGDASGQGIEDANGYTYFQFGPMRWYVGNGNPNGVIEASKGDKATCQSDGKEYICRGSDVWSNAV